MVFVLPPSTPSTYCMPFLLNQTASISPGTPSGHDSASAMMITLLPCMEEAETSGATGPLSVHCNGCTDCLNPSLIIVVGVRVGTGGAPLPSQHRLPLLCAARIPVDGLPGRELRPCDYHSTQPQQSMPGTRPAFLPAQPRAAANVRIPVESPRYDPRIPVFRLQGRRENLPANQNSAH